MPLTVTSAFGDTTWDAGVIVGMLIGAVVAPGLLAETLGLGLAIPVGGPLEGACVPCSCCSSRPHPPRPNATQTHINAKKDRRIT